MLWYVCSVRRFNDRAVVVALIKSYQLFALKESLYFYLNVHQSRLEFHVLTAANSLTSKVAVTLAVAMVASASGLIVAKQPDIN